MKYGGLWVESGLANFSLVLLDDENNIEIHQWDSDKTGPITSYAEVWKFVSEVITPDTFIGIDLYQIVCFKDLHKNLQAFGHSFLSQSASLSQLIASINSGVIDLTKHSKLSTEWHYNTTFDKDSAGNQKLLVSWRSDLRNELAYCLLAAFHTREHQRTSTP